MKKHIVLLLLIVIMPMCAMEKYLPKKIFSALHSHVRINKQGADTSVLMQELSAKKSRFEEQLLESQLLVTKYVPEFLMIEDFVDKIDANPGQLLSYCYY